MQLPVYPIACNNNHETIWHNEKDCPMCFIIEQLRLANERILHPLPKQKVYTTEEISALHEKERRIAKLEKNNDGIQSKK